MNNYIRLSLWGSIGLIVVVLCSCLTKGRVTWGGDPVTNIFVSTCNCDAECWNTYTDDDGWYYVDGYADANDIITGELLLNMATLSNYVDKFDMIFQNWEYCPEEDKVCDRHDIDFGFKPMGGWEYNYWLENLESNNLNDIYDFFNFCPAF